MLITTQDEFVDYEITTTLGLVRGNTIRARHIGKDILAMLRMLVGGEITEYTKMLAEAREFILRAWWVVTLPGCAILTTVLAINLMGDGLRDAADPYEK